MEAVSPCIVPAAQVTQNMTERHRLNVYAGANSLHDYHDPEKQPLLPLVEIPSCLNPFKHDGVRIFAKMMTMLPSHNVKALPGTQTLQLSIETSPNHLSKEYALKQCAA